MNYPTFFALFSFLSLLAGVKAISCNGVQLWQNSFAYTKGDEVIFNNKLYTAKQWTYANAPPTHPDQWLFEGYCTPPIHNKVSCAGVPVWSSNIPYTTGNQVTYNGNLWTAVQWVQYNAPGDDSGSWEDCGECL